MFTKRKKKFYYRPSYDSNGFGDIDDLETSLLDYSDYTMDRLGEINKDTDGKSTPVNSSEPIDSVQPMPNAEDKAFAETLSELEGYVNTLQNLMNQSDAQEISKEFEATSQQYSKAIRTIKSQLEGLSKKVKELSDDPKCHIEHKIKQNTLNVYSNRLQSIMDRFNRMQQSYREINLGKIKKTLELSNITATEEDVNKIMENGDFSICDDIAVTAQKKDTLIALQDRHNEMLKLEEGLRKLAEIFAQISLLINENAETINQIEQNYTYVDDYLGEANLQLEKAVVHKISASKKKLCIAITVSIILIIIILIIGLSVGLKK